MQTGAVNFVDALCFLETLVLAQGILPPAAYTLGTLVKKQFLSVAKLLLGSCEGKTENQHKFKLKKCDESYRGSICSLSH